jgi:hypothetical protein
LQNITTHLRRSTPTPCRNVISSIATTQPIAKEIAMQNVITIGRELVPVEQIAYIEAFEPNGQFKPDKPYKGRVVLLNRETVLTETAPQDFAEAPRLSPAPRGQSRRRGDRMSRTVGWPLRVRLSRPDRSAARVVDGRCTAVSGRPATRSRRPIQLRRQSSTVCGLRMRVPARGSGAGLVPDAASARRSLWDDVRSTLDGCRAMSGARHVSDGPTAAIAAENSNCRRSSERRQREYATLRRKVT